MNKIWLTLFFTRGSINFTNHRSQGTEADRLRTQKHCNGYERDTWNEIKLMGTFSLERRAEICYPAGSFSGRCPADFPPRRWSPSDSRWNSTRCVHAGVGQTSHRNGNDGLGKKKYNHTPFCVPRHTACTHLFRPARLARGLCMFAVTDDYARQTDSFVPFR